MKKRYTKEEKEKLYFGYVLNIFLDYEQTTPRKPNKITEKKYVHLKINLNKK